MAFNLEDYEDVAARIKRFHEKYNSGRIVVDVISHDFKEGVILVEASVYRYAEDTLPAATDIALGIRDTFNPSMRKFYAEDTSTSAIGRAIGLLLGTDKRPTKQDMGRVETTPVKESPKSAPVSSGSITQAEIITDESDPWYTGVLGNKTQEPKEMSAQELLAQSLGAKPVGEICSHGNMRLLEGTSKAGKPYHGFVCPAPKDQQCSPIWYRVAPDGKWMRPVLGDE